MPEVVGPELKLEAFRRAPERTRHDAGIVDEDVDGCPGRKHAVGETPHAPVLSQVEVFDPHGIAAGRGPDITSHRLALLAVPYGEGHGGTRGGESARRLDADPRRGAGHNGVLPVEIDARDDLHRRRPMSEPGRYALHHAPSCGL